MKLRVILLGLLILAQIAVPFRMIQQRETVLREGELFRFKTEPIDPADPFQGRYVWLGIEQDYVRLTEQEADAIDYKTHGYATVSIDDQGFAQFSHWSDDKPSDTEAYLNTRALGRSIRWEELDDDPDNERKRIYKGLRIDIPFTRFYMDEAKAPRAERIARDASRADTCWVAVRILNGQAVIEDVLIEGQSIRDLATVE
ncbi:MULTISPECIES: GDYXXLXY domain-containing protein [unclassified Lentimonas]|uniref:GDYXXLXY domain-containing protein n=1 Tax=unclassified Lentimonas TaxID=2630993 RepID=UPI001326981E|nr:MULTISPECIES: GDYXXLXY domain-containing protein [unclassified Lentimonas]CAA6676482.1 Unannotated [Lentimonas sp. CC4]CAA6685322.1 Unannotated [Lentimonas sp. CC6]CAA7074954.1 Unannotated [Lentimonas sp. CC4]CAA7168351.1 Unannotated [Lentimonas sp. CC21]CAA7180595.1 Unannotated [Lentimonas sp. CC8]